MLGKLIRFRQTAIPEQKNDLFKRRMLGQVVNVIALIDQNALFAVDVADRALGGDDSAKSRGAAVDSVPVLIS